MSGLVKRSFALAGHRTSVALEPEFWDQLARFAAQRDMPLGRLVAELDAGRSPEQNLASVLRVFVVRKLTSS